MKTVLLVLALLISVPSSAGTCGQYQEDECHSSCQIFGGPGLMEMHSCTTRQVMIPFSNQPVTQVVCRCAYIKDSTYPEPLPPTYGPPCSPQDGSNYICNRWGWNSVGDNLYECGVEYSKPPIQEVE